ncbi:protein CURVATURE THYLAKOID 1D, chloroplastic-like isoform X2 [Miscanthus floridulus]|uniref:protein CURVATURE THYLAKOID 1D, chloroplastic-like isoform X2 n=1 Tax=Miscanthus floridulus TaxID=154761 RepID=UPI003458DC6D
MQYSAREPPAQNHPHPPTSTPRGSQKPQNPTRPASTERGEQREWEIMELCVSTTASVRATAAPRRGTSASTALPLHRRIPTRGWRCASAAVPDPVPSEGPASANYTVVVTEKPDTPADDKVEEVSAAPSGSAEAPVAELVSSEASPSPDDGRLDEILSKLNIEVTPTLILTGSAAFVALWVLSSVVAAIDSVPLLPKLLELVGTGYSIWFITRYLLFKESRDDLFVKFEDLIQRII